MQLYIPHMQTNNDDDSWWWWWWWECTNVCLGVDWTTWRRGGELCGIALRLLLLLQYRAVPLTTLLEYINTISHTTQQRLSISNCTGNSIRIRFVGGRDAHATRRRHRRPREEREWERESAQELLDFIYIFLYIHFECEWMQIRRSKKWSSTVLCSLIL